MMFVWRSADKQRWPLPPEEAGILTAQHNKVNVLRWVKGQAGLLPMIEHSCFLDLGFLLMQCTVRAVINSPLYVSLWKTRAWGMGRRNTDNLTVLSL